MRASIDLTRGDASEESDSSGSSQLEPSTKCPCLSSSLTAKLDEIAEGVSNIQKVLMFMKNMQQTFQCVICKGVVSTPTVAKCCGRIVGCQGCVTSWLQGHASCPHCASPIEGQFLLRGLDEVLQLCRQLWKSRPPPLLHPSLPPGSVRQFLQTPTVTLMIYHVTTCHSNYSTQAYSFLWYYSFVLLCWVSHLASLTADHLYMCFVASLFQLTDIGIYT